MTVAPRLGMLTGTNGEQIKADQSFLTASSVLFDAVYVPGGEDSIASLKDVPQVANFLREAYEHCKTIAASSAGVGLLATSIGAMPISDRLNTTLQLRTTTRCYVVVRPIPPAFFGTAEMPMRKSGITSVRSPTTIKPLPRARMFLTCTASAPKPTRRWATGTRRSPIIAEHLHWTPQTWRHRTGCSI